MSEQPASQEQGRFPVLELFLASSTALFMELLFIRWGSSEIPVFAYFKNFPLLAAFIGLGVGSLISERRKFYWLSSCWAFAALATIVTFATPLGLHDLQFPEPNLDVWDLPFDPRSPTRVWFKNLFIVFAILTCCAWSFIGPGQAIGKLIRSGPPLKMYTFDILGSLAGVLAFAFFSSLHTPPSVWLIVSAALLWFLGKKMGISPVKQGPPLAVLACIAVLAFAIHVKSDVIIKWSPYYRIEVRAVRDAATSAVKWYHLNVNRWIHQVMVNLEDSERGKYVPGTPDWRTWMMWRIQYDFPFYFKPSPQSVLIGGAGAGNDVAASLRNGAAHVTAVEIDPGIIEFGRSMHPSRPYSSDRVTIVNTDIRAFLRKSPEKFDLIIFSILDSHTALSSLSSLRLDNYVYTTEGIHDAVEHLTEDGIMCLSFYESNRTWLGQRMYSSIVNATGKRPAATRIGQICAFVFGPGITPTEAWKKLDDLKIGFENTEQLHGTLTVKPSTDDWPFLYSNPRGQPLVYYLSLFLLVLLGTGFVWWGLRGADATGAARIDWPMFFLGAGFLLIETKALAELSLLFGATWVVNTIVFAGVFVMVLLANWAVSAGASRYVKFAYLFLAISLLSWYFFPRAALNALDFWPRALTGSLLVVIPLFFAGILFATLFSRRINANIAFGSNLMGAVIGGAMEALSLLWGIRSLTLIALGFYGVVWVLSSKDKDSIPK